jgi:hypothetical protein
VRQGVTFVKHSPGFPLVLALRRLVLEIFRNDVLKTILREFHGNL